MWFLRNEKIGSIYYITACKDPYVVGRSSADITITSDSSISRTHANLKLNSENNLELIDCGSKYGTFVNEGIGSLTPIPPHKPIILKPKDKIMFGRLQSNWNVVNSKIKTVVSTLSEDTKVELNKMLKQVDGLIINEFLDECTHLTMPVLSITMKVLLSLSAGMPIVTPEYWKEFLRCVQTKQKLIDYKNYLPPLNESFLRMCDLNLDINLNRKVIFSGKRFIFMLSKHMAQFELVIRMAGGICTHLGQKLSKSELTKSNTIVIQYVGSGLTQTQRSQSSSDCQKVVDILKKNGKRAIPDVEIGLAIIYCSLEKYCNPDIKIISTEHVATTTLNLQTSTLLAKDTASETQSKNNKQFSTSCEIPDSELIKKAIPAEIVIDDSGSEDMECNMNMLGNESEATQKFIVPETTNKSSKRKNDSPEISTNKRINLEDDIESTSSQCIELESFLIERPSLSNVVPKPKIGTSSKRNLSTRNDVLSENENDDAGLFCFKNPAKKSRQIEPAHDNPFLDSNFNFKQRTRNTRSSASQSSLAATYLFATQDTQQNHTNNSNSCQSNRKFESNNSQGMPIDVSDYIKPVDLTTGTWLSSEFIKSMNVKTSSSAANDTTNDIKPTENDLWIESLKNCVKVENTAVVINNSALNVYYNENSKSSTVNSNNKKNFKAFRKVINYKKLTGIVNCKSINI